MVFLSSDYILTTCYIMNINDDITKSNNANVVNMDISELKDTLKLPDIKKIDKSVKLEEVIKDNNDYKYFWIPNNSCLNQ